VTGNTRHPSLSPFTPLAWKNHQEASIVPTGLTVIAKGDQREPWYHGPTRIRDPKGRTAACWSRDWPISTTPRTPLEMPVGIGCTKITIQVVLNPNGIPHHSPRLPRMAGLPWVGFPRQHSTSTRLCSEGCRSACTTQLELGNSSCVYPRVIPLCGPTLGWDAQSRWDWKSKVSPTRSLPPVRQAGR
jgi:hypothetical protein